MHVSASIALLVVALVSSGCVPDNAAQEASTSAETGSGAVPSSDASNLSTSRAPSSSLSAESGTALDSRGNVIKDLGESAQLLGSDGTVVASVTVYGYDVLTTCPGQFALQPSTGSYLVVDVGASFGTQGAAGDYLLVGPSMWQIVGTDGVVVEGEAIDTAEAWSCYDGDERLPNALAPGTTERGLLVLDTNVAEGWIEYVPVEGGGWSWPLDGD